VRGDVQGGLLACPAGQYVEVLPGHARGDERVGGVDGGALGAVRGGGVQQFHVLAYIGGGQPYAAAVGEVPYGQ
jgi:hypothetical protein